VSKAEATKLARIKELQDDSSLNFIQFRGMGLMRTPDTHGYVPLRSDDFSRIAYARFLGISKNLIEDLMHAMRVMSKDRSDLARYIAFRDQVWDSKKLEFTDDTIEWVYSSDIKPQPVGSKGYNLAWEFFCQLSAGDEGLARDYLQASAPLFMDRKPTGVVWFIGSGSNGKSAFINALYRIIGRHFTSMTTSAIEDGRDTPRLNGVLGNVCRESSESRVDDTERYKAIGTHEPFTVHKFHSQETVEVQTNFHTIFNANNIPVFSDKTRGARRRTLILPFPAVFKDDPSFEDRTFTDEFLGGMITLLLEQTKVIRDNGYRYKWSDATLKAKEAYDNDVNSAEAFLEHMKESGIVGFFNYSVLRLEYENWCAQNGLVPLGTTTLKRTMTNEVGAIRKPVRHENKVVQRYFFPEVVDQELVWLDNGYGLRNKEEALIVEKVLAKDNQKLSEEW
jgi:phage/plasmid-associated DNA primase